MKKTLTVLLISAFLANALTSQNYFGLLNAGQQTVSIGANANPNLNANADYLVGFDTQHKTIRRYGFVAQANFPLFSQRGFDFDLRIGAGALFAFTEKFRAISGISWNLSRTADINGRYIHTGFKLDLFPGYYGKRWVIAPHLAAGYQPWIHIKHSAYVIQAFQDLYPGGDGPFSGPRNGWFYQNYFLLQTGLAVAYFQPQWHLHLTAGFQQQPNRVGLVSLPDIGIMPIYGGVNFGYSIPDRK